MKYWDSSALVPLCVEEASTPHMRQLLTVDPIIITCLDERLSEAAEREGFLIIRA